MKKLMIYAQEMKWFYNNKTIFSIFIDEINMTVFSDIKTFELISNQEDGTTIVRLMMEKNENDQVLLIKIDGIISHCKEIELTGERYDIAHQIKKSLYEFLSLEYVPRTEWGIMIGIRPTKLVHEWIDLGYQPKKMYEMLCNEYLLSNAKAKLLLRVSNYERPHLYPVDLGTVSLYICIPFCPSRCVYCSFPSNDITKKRHLIDSYIEKLLEEIEISINRIHTMGKVIDCVYIGGGTPSSISAIDLEKILIKLAEHIKLKALKEFTVEAGRPDTIDEEKLILFKRYYVNRVCINPQTMNDKTLTIIGRKHSVLKIVETMTLAQRLDFEIINMDLILGLPRENVFDFKRSLDHVISLNPENITLHALAIKRGTKLKLYDYENEEDHAKLMMNYAYEALEKAGYTPYYLYRQKKMADQLENVGFTKKGFASLYNMRMIEEKHNIVAVGAGASSKIINPNSYHFDRNANFKGLEDYIDRFDEIKEQKQMLWSKL